MTDRRRNLLILLLVAGLLAGSLVVIATQPTKLGLDLKGGVSLIFQAKPTKQSKVTPRRDQPRDGRHARARRQPRRVRAGDPAVGQRPDRRLAPRRQERRRGAPAGRHDGPAALLRLGGQRHRARLQDQAQRPERHRRRLGRRRDAGHQSLLRRRHPRVDEVHGHEHGQGARRHQYYLVDKKTKKVLAGPDETLRRPAARGREQAGSPFNAKRRRQGPAGLLGRPRRAGDPKGPPEPRSTSSSPTSRCSTATRSRTPSRTSTTARARAASRTSPFDFTGKGASIWKSVTRKIAQRGQDQSLGVGAERVEPALRDRARQRAHLGAVHRLVAEPRRHRRRRAARRSPAASRIQSAQKLANLLKTGALPIKLELISASQVSATLGKQALDQGLIAGIAGFVVVALFLLIFYRVLGVIAVGALVVYALYFFALIKLIPITLTLPGIAGLILTIGVAADANIVIFERVKEEVRAGRSIPAGIAAGYKKRPVGDHRRQRRDLHGRVHPLHGRPGRGQGLRLHARRRHHRLVPHRRAADAGRAGRAGPLAAHRPPVGAGRGQASAGRSASTSWARRSGSSRCPA